MAKVKSKIELGKCPFCLDEIISKDDRGHVIYGDNYGEIYILLSDRSKMKIGVCLTCCECLTDDHIESLMEEHRKFWILGLQDAFAEKKKTLDRQRDEQLEYYDNLSSVRFAKSERDLE